MDTAMAHIADTPLGLQERDEMMQETAALVVRLERLQILLCRDGYLRAVPASDPVGT
jgi:hypothetical protein